MHAIIGLLIFFASFAVWYVHTGVTLLINGFIYSGRQAPWIPFIGIWQDFLWSIPGGWRRKLEFTCGDEEWARQLPGPIHFFFAHVLILLGPLVLYLAWL